MLEELMINKFNIEFISIACILRRIPPSVDSVVSGKSPAAPPLFVGFSNFFEFQVLQVCIPTLQPLERY